MPQLFDTHQTIAAAIKFCQLNVNNAQTAIIWKTTMAIDVIHWISFNREFSDSKMFCTIFSLEIINNNKIWFFASDLDVIIDKFQTVDCKIFVISYHYAVMYAMQRYRNLPLLRSFCFGIHHLALQCKTTIKTQVKIYVRKMWFSGASFQPGQSHFFIWREIWKRISKLNFWSWRASAF